VAGFWMLLKIYIFYSGRDPRDPPNRPGRAAPGPQISSKNHRELLIFETGWGTGWPPLGCPGQNANFKYKIPPKSQPRVVEHRLLMTNEDDTTLGRVTA
jgi:hypothetical protein